MTMQRKFTQVYQFKITLKGIRPPIWRRIQVPSTYSFAQLHHAIQRAMGWYDEHLHEFRILRPDTGLEAAIGLPDANSFADEEVLDERRQKIAKYFSLANPKALYIYDFGDDWEHMVVLEKILPPGDGVVYPICITGKRACPPEDCGGVWGYAELLEVLANPAHPRHQELKEWVGGEFDPEAFSPQEVRF